MFGKRVEGFLPLGDDGHQKVFGQEMGQHNWEDQRMDSFQIFGPQFLLSLIGYVL